MENITLVLIYKNKRVYNIIQIIGGLNYKSYHEVMGKRD